MQYKLTSTVSLSNFVTISHEGSNVDNSIVSDLQPFNATTSYLDNYKLFFFVTGHLWQRCKFFGSFGASKRKHSCHCTFWAVFNEVWRASFAEQNSNFHCKRVGQSIISLLEDVKVQNIAIEDISYCYKRITFQTTVNGKRQTSTPHFSTTKTFWRIYAIFYW